MRKIYHSIPLVLVILTGLSLQSCEKTEYDYLKRPYNDIQQFVVLGSTGDSTKSVIIGDSINIYWNPDVPLPSNITPKIVVDKNATISPASGASVPFNKNTIYTVTAENGDVKTYRLNPVLTLPVPSISSVSTPLTWLNSTQVNIFGEYFLANTQPSEIKAYMQRVSDGFEFPLQLVANRITNYSIVANLPDFSAEQDIGLHKLYVKAGNRVAKSVDVIFQAPSISFTNRIASLVQEGKDVHPGDSLTINYAVSDSYGGKVAGYYSTKNVRTVLLYVAFDAMIEVNDLVITDSTIKFKVPETFDQYIGQSILQCRLFFKTAPQDQATLTAYRHTMYLTTPSPIVAKK